MCVTAIIAAGIAIGTAAAGAYSSIQSANANKDAARYEAAIKEKELYQEREQQRLAALQQENAKAAEFNQARSSAFAAIGASGLGENLSFFQGADPEQQRAFLRDVQTIRLNMSAKQASIADEVGLTEERKRIGVFNANMSKVGAVTDFIKTAMGAVSYYGAYATPKPAH